VPSIRNRRYIEGKLIPKKIKNSLRGEKRPDPTITIRGACRQETKRLRPASTGKQREIMGRDDCVSPGDALRKEKGFRPPMPPYEKDGPFPGRRRSEQKKSGMRYREEKPTTFPLKKRNVMLPPDVRHADQDHGPRNHDCWGGSPK